MNTSPSIFPLGREALAWLRQGGRPTRIGLAHRLSYRWQSFWFERNLALQDRLRPASPINAAPVFILGLWRSGTTYLHDLLGACPEMICPATWQCMSPATFRLRHPPRASQVIARPMDKFAIGAFSPQEDEFALLALGIPSVYRCFFDPRRLDEAAQWLKPDVWADLPDDWIEIWRNFLAGAADGRTGRLLLKSPSHMFRIRALLHAFPEAQYVWVVRDPEETFFSNRKMWSAMFQEYALWDWEASQLDEFLRQAFSSAAECLAYAIDVLPKNRLVVVDFNRLTNEPMETIKAINDRLRIGDWEKMQTTIRIAADEKVNYRKESHTSQTVMPEMQTVIEHTRQAYKAALTKYGL
ncbi:MAG: sulfotransferase [Pseudomonadota bacterium]